MYIVLTPKINNPNKISDFRSISFGNVCYKVISKLLSNWLKLIIHKLIGKEQSGFLATKSTVDNILVMQEVAHFRENDTDSPFRMIFKVEIENAYDTLEWNVILATLRSMNFPKIWIFWVKACLSLASLSFIINGQPSKWMKASRRVRQGDPLSPYLFILVSQNLIAIMNHALHLKRILGLMIV